MAPAPPTAARAIAAIAQSVPVRPKNRAGSRAWYRYEVSTLVATWAVPSGASVRASFPVAGAQQNRPYVPSESASGIRDAATGPAGVASATGPSSVHVATH